MGKIIITEDTTKNPITMIGRYAGECWGADTSDSEKNYKTLFPLSTAYQIFNSTRTDTAFDNP